jgi:hypothetical protein
VRESGHQEDLPRQLRSALDAWQPAEAPESFRASLAKRFVTGEVAEFSVEEQLSSWQPTAARPEFREDLRDAFVAGELVEGVPLGVRRTPILSWRPMIIATLVAAAALLLWLVPGILTPQGWRLVDPSIRGEVLVNGERVAFTDSAILDRSFSGSGSLLQTTGESLTVVNLGEGIVLEMIPESRFEVIERQGDDELLTIVLESGGVRVSTCPTHGDCVRVRTPEGEVTLSGRSLGVTVLDGGTCLCVLDGRGTLVGESLAVASNTTAWISRQTGEISFDSDTLHHRESLASFAEVSGRYFY